jgi:hypothetical protein
MLFYIKLNQINIYFKKELVSTFLNNQMFINFICFLSLLVSIFYQSYPFILNESIRSKFLRKKDRENSHVLFFRFYYLISLMGASGNNLRDPSLCSCFSGSYQYTICNKIQWSTLSIGAALLIIVRTFRR